MPKNILCIGGTRTRRLELFLELLPFLQKKNKVELICIGSKSAKNKVDDLKKLGSKISHYSGSPREIDYEIRTRQVYNESKYSLYQWFDSNREYEGMWLDRRIYIIDQNSPLVKWYLSVKRYSILSSEDKVLVFLQYWQLHNKEHGLWFTPEGEFYPAIWSYENVSSTLFCYFEDSVDVKDAIELYCFLKEYLPRHDGRSAIKTAMNCIKRNNYNILSLDSKCPELKKNWTRLRRIVI